MNQTSKLVEALENILESESISQVFSIAQQALESYKDGWVSEVRKALKDYVESEGCGCCSNYSKHESSGNKLGELLGFDKYLDDSGYDLTTLPTPPQTKTI